MRSIFLTFSFCLLMLSLTWSQNPSTAQHGTITVKRPDTLVYNKIDTMPVFIGNISEYLAKRIVYPETAMAKGITGTVYLTFVVEKDGSVSGLKILKGVSPVLDTAAIQACRKMPKWKPGTKNGSTVSVRENIPVNFYMR